MKHLIKHEKYITCTVNYSYPRRNHTVVKITHVVGKGNIPMYYKVTKIIFRKTVRYFARFSPSFFTYNSILKNGMVSEATILYSKAILDHRQPVLMMNFVMNNAPGVGSIA